MKGQQFINGDHLALSIFEDGFAIIPNAISSRVVEMILGEMGIGSGPGFRQMRVGNPEFGACLRHELFMSGFYRLIGREASVVRSIFFNKTPESNWAVPWHQDLTIAVADRREGPWVRRMVGQRWRASCSSAS